MHREGAFGSHSGQNQVFSEINSWRKLAELKISRVFKAGGTMKDKKSWEHTLAALEDAYRCYEKVVEGKST